MIEVLVELAEGTEPKTLLQLAQPPSKVQVDRCFWFEVVRTQQAEILSIEVQ